MASDRPRDTYEREAAARAAFEDALEMYLALPPDAYGRIIVHFGSGQACKPAVEAQRPARPAPSVAGTPRLASGANVARPAGSR